MARIPNSPIEPPPPLSPYELAIMELLAEQRRQREERELRRLGLVRREAELRDGVAGFVKGGGPVEAHAHANERIFPPVIPEGAMRAKSEQRSVRNSS